MDRDLYDTVPVIALVSRSRRDLHQDPKVDFLPCVSDALAVFFPVFLLDLACSRTFALVNSFGDRMVSPAFRSGADLLRSVVSIFSSVPLDRSGVGRLKWRASVRCLRSDCNCRARLRRGSDASDTARLKMLLLSLALLLLALLARLDKPVLDPTNWNLLR